MFDYTFPFLLSSFTILCTTYNAAFPACEGTTQGSTMDMDGADFFLACFMMFERASQQPATGGLQAGGVCAGVKFAFGLKGVEEDGRQS